jgi:hypothetical protein
LLILEALRAQVDWRADGHRRAERYLCTDRMLGFLLRLAGRFLDRRQDYLNASPKKYGQIIRPNTAFQKDSLTKPIVNSQPANQIGPMTAPTLVGPPPCFESLPTLLLLCSHGSSNARHSPRRAECTVGCNNLLFTLAKVLFEKRFG